MKEKKLAFKKWQRTNLDVDREEYKVRKKEAKRAVEIARKEGHKNCMISWERRKENSGFTELQRPGRERVRERERQTDRQTDRQ